MLEKRQLNEKWIKASVLGTIWAASEIVFGSFLHNLRVPLGGNILTGIGLIILIGAGNIWREPGLFWRAGLITALMKSISPSAVIMGPMVAIFSQSVMLEIAVRVFGRNPAGYIFGGVLAMSWNLFQIIGGFLISYGYNLVELYTSFVAMAQRRLGLEFDLLWLPVILLFGLHIVLGMISGVLGVMVGRNLQNTRNAFPAGQRFPEIRQASHPADSGFSCSLVWLIGDILMLVGSLYVFSYLGRIYWVAAFSAVVLVWAIRYRNSLRRLVKPGFWVLFIVLTMLSSVLLKRNGSAVDGLITGLQMNLRAAAVLLGFAVFGMELKNPAIRDFCRRTRFRPLPVALELSFESLPSVISDMPHLKIVLRKPVLVFSQILSQVDNRLAEFKRILNNGPGIHIITGKGGEGKTSCVRTLISEFRQEKLPVAGILAPRILDDKDTVGYDIVDIRSGESTVFLRTEDSRNYEKIGKFSIYPDGLRKGVDILRKSSADGTGIVIIDEIGPLELNGNGWAAELRKVLMSDCSDIIITVRESLVGQVISRWNLSDPAVYRPDERDCGRLHRAVTAHYRCKS